MGGQRSCRAASMCFLGQAAIGEVPLWEQDGFGAGKAWLAQDQTSEQHPQLQDSTVALGKVLTVTGHATAHPITCGFQLSEGTDRSTPAPGAACPPGHTLQLCCSQTPVGRRARAPESQAQAPGKQLHAKGSGFPEICCPPRAAGTEQNRSDSFLAPTHESSIADGSPPGVR